MSNTRKMPMYDRMQTLTQEQMTKFHDAAIEVLGKTGVAFHDSEALQIFRKHGFKVDGKRVLFKEKDVAKALESAPHRFRLNARNPEKSLIIGEDHLVFAPGYGPPFVAESSGRQRNATMEDYDNLCKLVQTSKTIDMNGFIMVSPFDVPPDKAHLDMLFSNIVLCDKPFMGSPISKQAARDNIEMLTITWGDKKNIQETPLTISLINPLSPLQFSGEMAGSLIELARNGQACVVSSAIMAGSSGPVTLPGVLAQLNTEVLAGLTLAQLVKPGAPIIYGCISGIMDMRTGGFSIGSPEFSILASAAAQMARFYNLPSRNGGALTDAHLPDAQAGVESALALYTAARNGSNFTVHACGILGSFISMSFEKFIIDEELCGYIRRCLKPLEVTDENIDLEMIQSVGIGGEYLTQDKTFEHCRTEFYIPDLYNRKNHKSWIEGGGKRIDAAASDILAQRLANYVKPDIDPVIEKDLAKYVAQKKND
jgi:trimethylamine--corrinoid protein Co-methyltransferase